MEVIVCYISVVFETQCTAVAVTVAGEIRLLASDKLVSESRNTGPISVSDVLHVLRQQVTVAQCDVFGYPSIESDVIVIVLPITASPTPLQASTWTFITDYLFIRK